MAAYHALPDGNMYAVRRSGQRRAARVGISRDAAWNEAKSLAERNGMIAYLHDNSGRISERFAPTKQGGS